VFLQTSFSANFQEVFADSQMSENALNHVENFLQRLRGKPNGERRVQKGTARYEREPAKKLTLDLLVEYATSSHRTSKSVQKEDESLHTEIIFY
jgi:hypothetical protein